MDPAVAGVAAVVLARPIRAGRHQCTTLLVEGAVMLSLLSLLVLMVLWTLWTLWMVLVLVFLWVRDVDARRRRRTIVEG